MENLASARLRALPWCLPGRTGRALARRATEDPVERGLPQADDQWTAGQGNAAVQCESDGHAELGRPVRLPEGPFRWRNSARPPLSNQLRAAPGVRSALAFAGRCSSAPGWP